MPDSRRPNVPIQMHQRLSHPTNHYISPHHHTTTTPRGPHVQHFRSHIPHSRETSRDRLDAGEARMMLAARSSSLSIFDKVRVVGDMTHLSYYGPESSINDPSHPFLGLCSTRCVIRLALRSFFPPVFTPICVIRAMIRTRARRVVGRGRRASTATIPRPKTSRSAGRHPKAGGWWMGKRR